jgi:phosphoribosylanthranilate isomerase
MTWIKICGMTTIGDASAAVEAGADAIGLIFAASPRRVTPSQARKIAEALPPAVEKVGVFVNESVERIAELIPTVGLTAVQLQGDETMEMVAELRRKTKRPRLRVIKTLAIARGMESSIRAFAHWPGLDAVLLDSVVMRAAAAGGGGTMVRGGTGVPFHWRRAAAFLPGLSRRTRVIVAGGLTPQTVAEAVHILRPWGVDVCSAVERQPGRKDHDKVRAFIAAARAADK